MVPIAELTKIFVNALILTQILKKLETALQKIFRHDADNQKNLSTHSQKLHFGYI